MKKIKNDTREKYYEDQLEEWDLIKGNKSAAAAAVAAAAKKKKKNNGDG